MKEITLNEYQAQAMSTCMPTSNNYVYMAEGLVGEVGEFTSKAAKAVRKGNAAISGNQFNTVDEALLDGRQGELGDILWFTAGLASVFGWSLESVGRDNLMKLQSRKLRGVIDGNGDNR